MRIGIVGGIASAGHQVEFHGGHMNGAGASRLEALVDRVDVLVIVTDVNSHGAVTHARALARRAHRPVKLLRRLSPGQLRALLN